MKGFIYKITNKVNNMSYIGQTRYSVEFRWRQHLHKKDNTYFHNALRKYGPESFTVETLEECDSDKLNEREMFYIAKYNTFKKGYNLTIGGDGNRRLVLDDKYDEIKNLYLSGFSSNKIASLYNLDKGTIVKILKQLGVKIRNNNLSFNQQEFKELVQDYKSGYSLRELAKRYNCTSVGLKEFLKRKGVDLKEKYNILEDSQAQDALIDDYVDNVISLSEIQKKYHCSYATFKKILTLHGINQKGKGRKYKLTDSQSLEVIKAFKEGQSVKSLSKKYKVDSTTIYSLFKRYHVDYLTV